MRTLAATVVLSCLLAGCAGVTPRSSQQFVATEADFADIAAASLKFVERTAPVATIVLPSDADPRVRAALKRLRPTIAADKIPPSQTYKLPAGYFALQSFTIDTDGVARFEGRLGPVRKVPEPPADDDCGTQFSIPFVLEGDGWASHTLMKSVCWPKRVWWPVDETQPTQAR
ncbi:MAG: hypothetical protein J0I77_20625 [Rudaea sp.]|uniref:hypothetical protein n=1 Tax=unclassified Rudaea TaxID=2627037 RepID=UPI0010F537DA|nr:MULTISPECIES: hypothetical protein [unclassified Rudaea]MBN8888130.1 hypothetical protein [Rudaea sp.]MBR0347930.1 hypothetical protein [Rudaea sp.]